MKNPNLPLARTVLMLLFLLFFAGSHLHAQPEFDEDVQDTPVDGGVGLLLAAGAGYGLRKIRRKENSGLE